MVENKNDLQSNKRLDKAVRLDGYEKAIFGFTLDNKIVYHYDMMILNCSIRENLDLSEAMAKVDALIANTKAKFGTDAPVFFVESPFRD